MKLDDFVDLFAPAGHFRYQCKLCGRELYGTSRRRHVKLVHRTTLSAGDVIATRGKYAGRIRVIEAAAPARAARIKRRLQRWARIQKQLAGPTQEPSDETRAH